jgi:hypothetical protein
MLFVKKNRIIGGDTCIANKNACIRVGILLKAASYIHIWVKGLGGGAR